MVPLRRLVLLASVFAAGPALAQEPGWDPAKVYASRESLQQLRARFAAAAASPAYSAELRDEARRHAERLEQRLAVGDFKVGDRILLTVERERTLSDTFTVAEGQRLELPSLGPVSLVGVLRSEAEAHVRSEIARFVRDPVVRVRTFIRVSMTGGVGRPGFYVVPTELVFTDALTLAQGFGPNARLDDITIRRNDRVAVGSATIAEAIAEGLTLDQLDVRTGDQIVVGARGSLGALESPLRAVGLILALPFALSGIIALF